MIGLKLPPLCPFLQGLLKGIFYPSEKLNQETEVQGMGNMTRKECEENFQEASAGIFQGTSRPRENQTVEVPRRNALRRL